jgi:hypothetical protein
MPANSISRDALRAWGVGYNLVPGQIFREILKLIANCGRRLPRNEVRRSRTIPAITAGVRLDTATAARFSAPAPSTYRLEPLLGAWSAILPLPKLSGSAILALKPPGIRGMSE